MHSYSIYRKRDSNIVLEQEKETIALYRLRLLTGRGLVVLGVFGILFYMVPLFVSYTMQAQQDILGVTTVYAEEPKRFRSKLLINPLEPRYWKTLFTVSYYDPGPAFFQEMERNYSATEEITAKIDTAYNKMMYITIPTLQIKQLRLYPNISGNDKNTYERVLRQGVAHLKHTPLPGDGGNSIIYGHSGLPRILGKYPDWLSFSKLEKIKLGDPISIQRDNSMLRYRVISKKIITVDKLAEFVKPTKREQITLITCWPLGIGSRRLVVIAQRYE